jgi:3-dehydroquinate dehydratase/shikimate dehydrogenase
MICVSIGRTRHKQMIAEHARLAELGAKLVELRLDYIGRAVDLKRLLEKRPTPVVVTCRRKADGGRWDRTEAERLVLLRSAIVSGADFVDLEEDVASTIPRYGKTKRIVSLHDFEKTPADLEEIAQRLAKLDADVVKIATMANSFADTIRMLRLVEKAKIPTIGICMGEKGVLTRILGCRYGSPFTFATTSTGRKVAPGQLTFDQMQNLYRIEEINAKTRLFAVIADPVGHSLSPLVHNAAFQSQGLPYRYFALQIAPDDLPIFIQWCKQNESFGGLSVTIPHKETIVKLLNQVETAASSIGAVNTVIFDRGEALGYNTDYRAAMESIEVAMQKKWGEGSTLQGRAVLVLGAGGVSRAISQGLRQRGAIVAIASRSVERSEALAKDVGGRALPWDRRYDIKPGLIVNGTPMGMHPNINETPYEKRYLDERQIIFDTVYNPEQTLLLKEAREVGCTVVTGVSMFLRQAAYQYKLFTDSKAPIEVMQKALRKAISPVNYEIDDEADDTASDAADDD